MTVLPSGAAIRVRTPASSANLGPGFDSIGLALGVWDELDFTVTADPGLRIEVDLSAAGSERIRSKWRRRAVTYEGLVGHDPVVVAQELKRICAQAGA